MKYESFKEMIDVIISIFEKEREISEKLEDVLCSYGSDSRVMLSFLNNEVDRIIDVLAEEVNLETDDAIEWINYLVFDVLYCNSDLTFQVNDIEYVSNTENIWKVLNKDI